MWVLQELRRLRNFQALVAIVAGLHHPCVVQMKEVWKVMSLSVIRPKCGKKTKLKKRTNNES